MVTKKELDILSQLYESIEGKGGLKDDILIIKNQVLEQNHNVGDVTRAVAVNRQIAENARAEAQEAMNLASNNRKEFIRFIVAFCICLLGIVLGIGIPVWMSP